MAMPRNERICYLYCLGCLYFLYFDHLSPSLSMVLLHLATHSINLFIKTTMSFSSTKLEIFRCFNCKSCNKPFSRNNTGPSTPVGLLCGATICKGCFERDTHCPQNERIHRCRKDKCFECSNPAFYLINLLADSPIALNSQKNGYFLTEKFIPECPICIRKLEPSNECLSPMDLLCGHAICSECSQKLRQIISFDDDDGWMSVYQLRCPMCRAENQYNEERSSANTYIDFLNELPKMEAQLTLVKWLKRKDFFVNFFKFDNISVLFGSKK